MQRPRILDLHRLVHLLLRFRPAGITALPRAEQQVAPFARLDRLKNGHCGVGQRHDMLAAVLGAGARQSDQPRLTVKLGPFEAADLVPPAQCQDQKADYLSIFIVRCAFPDGDNLIVVWLFAVDDQRPLALDVFAVLVCAVDGVGLTDALPDRPGEEGRDVGPCPIGRHWAVLLGNLPQPSRDCRPINAADYQPVQRLPVLHQVPLDLDIGPRLHFGLGYAPLQELQIVLHDREEALLGFDLVGSLLGRRILAVADVDQRPAGALAGFLELHDAGGADG